MDTNYLSVTAVCRDNPACVFSGGDLQVDITLTNTGMVDIGYPLQYVLGRGPSIKLIDIASGEERSLQVNLAPYNLLKEFTTIKPGQSVKLDALISKTDITALRADNVDLSVEIVPAARIQIAGHDELVPFAGAAKLRVNGIDRVGDNRFD